MKNSKGVIIIIIVNLGQKTRLNNQQKKRTCKIVDSAVPADHRIKLKECEKKDKYLDLARELKKLWNMQVTIIPKNSNKRLQKGLEERGSNGNCAKGSNLIILTKPEYVLQNETHKILWTSHAITFTFGQIPLENI